MKKLILTALVALALPAFAQNTNNNGTASEAMAGANNQGNAQSITFEGTVFPADTTTRISGTQTIKNVPSVSGPQLTSSFDACMGSSSGSANGPGFGFSLGGTWTDQNCVMLKSANTLWNMGMKAAAMARLCTDPANKEALELTGYECPQTTRAKKAVVAQEPLDPYVRARLGLPALQ